MAILTPGTHSNIHDLLVWRHHQPSTLCALQPGIQVKYCRYIWHKHVIGHASQTHLLSWSGSIPSYSRASFYARFSYSGNLWQKAGHARSYFSDVIVFTQYNVFQVQISYYNEKRGMMLYFSQFLLEFLLVTSRSIESTTLTHSASRVSSGGENQHCALPMSICQFNQACNQLILI